MAKKKPEVDIDLEEIRELASEGNTQEDIADLLGVNTSFISSNPEANEAYKLGLSDMRCSLRHWQFQSAKSGNTTMLIWLGKIYLGQKEESETAVTLKREDDALTKSLENLAMEMEAEKQ